MEGQKTNLGRKEKFSKENKEESNTKKWNEY